MAERKEIVHYCVKCGKRMKYKEKKMLYLYDIKTVNRGGFEMGKTNKRFAFNLCESCADEVERMIMSWKDENELN